MIDISSNPNIETCTNVTSTHSVLRTALNEISDYRGTSYYYPQKKIAELFAKCLQELGFNVTVFNDENYYNHIVLNDYSEDVCFQFWNSAASTCNLSFLYPRHKSATQSFGSIFNNGTTCNVTIRMIGAGVGKTKTLLILGSSSVPALTNYYCIYFTDVKYLPTGEMKKAIVLQYSTTYLFYIYDSDWKFLDGFKSDLNTVFTTNSHWYDLKFNTGYGGHLDPYTSFKIFQEQSYFPEIPVISNNGLWEFPDILFNPYGQLKEDDVSENLKYSLTEGNIYQIGSKKFICNDVSQQNYLFRVE